ncbi:hypothetical protein ACIGFJ_12735 [Brevundimonas diminuta]|uniref:hypothetical protein n=1 Tax=Brevundimonas diminuta TaxID=293 RepID=UPI0037C6CF1B
MTDPMELVGRLEKRIAYDKKHYPPVDPLFTQAAACIREMVERQTELADAARAYFVGWMMDEADDSGPIFTGCSTEQHLAAKRLGEALPPAPGAE